MAQVPLSMNPVQFSCSICLELLKDPVTIPCGHSYCMSCLTDYWDCQPICSCPQCRTTFSPRPTLGRNTLLAEMLQSLGAVKLSEGPSAPPLYEDHGFEHATFDVSSVRPERTDGEVRTLSLAHTLFLTVVFSVAFNKVFFFHVTLVFQRLLGETRRYLAQQIEESESELQQLKQTLRSFSVSTKDTVCLKRNVLITALCAAFTLDLSEQSKGNVHELVYSS